jgi:hypothetical protein
MTRLGRLFALIGPAVLIAAAPPAEPAPDKARKICREAEHETGSHIRTSRRCHTAEEWDKLDQAKSGLPLSAQVTAGQGDALDKPRPQ